MRRSRIDQGLNRNTKCRSHLWCHFHLVSLGWRLHCQRMLWCSRIGHFCSSERRGTHLNPPHEVIHVTVSRLLLESSPALPLRIRAIRIIFWCQSLGFHCIKLFQNRCWLQWSITTFCQRQGGKPILHIWKVWSMQRRRPFWSTTPPTLAVLSFRRTT